MSKTTPRIILDILVFLLYYPASTFFLSALTQLPLLRIRLQRVGRKKKALYRIVVAEHARPVKNKFIEILGHYDPTLKPHQFVLNKTKYQKWVGNGAQPSERLKYLVDQAEKVVKK